MRIRPAILLAAAIVAAALHSLVLLGVQTDEQVKVALVLQMTLLGAFGWWSSRVSRTYLNAPLIVMAAIFFWHSTFLVAHFFIPLEEFQYTGTTFAYGRAFLPQTVALVTLCMVCTAGGVVDAFRAARREERAAIASGRTPATHQRLSRTASLFAWACLLAFAGITAAELFSEGAQRFSMQYLTTYLAPVESPVERVYQAVKFFGVPAILMVFAARTRRGVSVAAAAICGGLIFVGLLMGSRSIPFLFLAAVLVSVDRFGRRVSFVEVVGLAVAGSALSFIVDHSRVYGLGLQVFNLTSTGKSVDLLAILSNAGGVVKTVLRTFAFSQQMPPLYGRSIADAALYLLPRPLVDGAGFRTDFVRPSDWLVEHSADVAPGEGMGYSLVAEGYLNFGFAGCLLFALLGWFVARQFFRHVVTGDRLAWLSAYNVAIVLSLHMRNDVAAYLRVLVYGQLLIEALRWIDRHGVAIRFAPAARLSLGRIAGRVPDGP